MALVLQTAIICFIKFYHITRHIGCSCSPVSLQHKGSTFTLLPETLIAFIQTAYAEPLQFHRYQVAISKIIPADNHGQSNRMPAIITTRIYNGLIDHKIKRLIIVSRCLYRLINHQPQVLAGRVVVDTQ